MANQQITAAVSDVSLSPPKSPNFPLPRELRDHIYSYLLDGEHVRIKRTWSRQEYEDNFDNDRSGPRAYHFHTNVLGVNRAIHDETEELLYKRNMFVVLNYEYFGLGNENGGLFWLPVVSNKHASRMKRHSMCIRVSPGTAGVKDPMISGNASLQSAIFLARDLDVFCLIMTTAGSSCMQTDLLVNLDQNGAGVPTFGGLGRFITPYRVPPQFHCELRHTKHHKIDAATQRQILAPMARILAPSQHVSFTGIVCDSGEVEHLKRVMSPTLNCAPAFHWALFEALSLAKDVTDAAVPHDDIRFVMNLYHTIARTLRVWTYTHIGHEWQRQDFLRSCPEAVEACDMLALEALVNVACCVVKAGDVKELDEASNAISKSRQRRKDEGRSKECIPSELEAPCDHVILWKVLYYYTPDNMPTVREAVNFLAHPGRERHGAHDTDVLLRQPDQEALLTRRNLPLEQCSAFQLPLPNTSCHKALLEQERFRGWFDMDLPRSLDECMKTHINNQQKQYGIKVTAFDELLQ